MAFTSKLSINTLGDRVSGSIWGMLLGDAYCFSSQSNYDQADIESYAPQAKCGTDVHHPPFAGQKPEKLSPYGHGSIELINSLIEHDGFHLKDYAERLINAPVTSSPQLDKVTCGMRENYQRNTRNPFEFSDFQEGINDEGLINVSRVCPLVAAHANDPELPQILEIFTRVLQRNDRALAYVCLQSNILIHLWRGLPVDEVFSDHFFSKQQYYGFDQEMERMFNEACMLLKDTVPNACEQLGQEELLVSAFPCCIHNFLRHETDWKLALSQCALAGGDSSGRASLIGSWLGASLGKSSIPQDWLTHIQNYQDLDRQINELMHMVV